MDLSSFLPLLGVFSASFIISGLVVLLLCRQAQTRRSTWLPIMSTVTAFHPFPESIRRKGILEASYTYNGVQYTATFRNVLLLTPIGESLELLHDPQAPAKAVVPSLDAYTLRLYPVAVAELMLGILLASYAIFRGMS